MNHITPRTPSEIFDDKDDGRTRLIKAAMHLFATQGYEGASIANIAKEAGVSKGLARFHFGSKQDLYDAVVRYLIDKWAVNRDDNFAAIVERRFVDKFLVLMDQFGSASDDISFLHRNLVEQPGISPLVSDMFEAMLSLEKRLIKEEGLDIGASPELVSLIWMCTEFGFMFFLPKLAKACNIDLEDKETLAKIGAAYMRMYSALHNRSVHSEGDEGRDL